MQRLTWSTLLVWWVCQFPCRLIVNVVCFRFPHRWRRRSKTSCHSWSVKTNASTTSPSALTVATSMSSLHHSVTVDFAITVDDGWAMICCRCRMLDLCVTARYERNEANWHHDKRHDFLSVFGRGRSLMNVWRKEKRKAKVQNNWKPNLETLGENWPPHLMFEEKKL